MPQLQSSLRLSRKKKNENANGQDKEPLPARRIERRGTLKLGKDPFSMLAILTSLHGKTAFLMVD